MNYKFIIVNYGLTTIKYIYYIITTWCVCVCLLLIFSFTSHVLGTVLVSVCLVSVRPGPETHTFSFQDFLFLSLAAKGKKVPCVTSSSCPWQQKENSKQGRVRGRAGRPGQ
jgi:hypothetical protein